MLTSVAGPTVVDWFETRTADGVRRLQLDLVSPQSTDVEILLDGNLPRDVSQTETQILLPRVLDVDGYSSELAVWVDDAFEPGLTELGDWDTKDRQQLSAQLRSLGASEPWLVFVNEDAEPAPVVVQLDRGVPRLRAASVTLVAVTETGVDYGFTFQWDVSQAAADTFVVRLPSWLSGTRFEVPGLRQLQTTQIGADIVEFRMQLVEPVTGRFLVSATASLPFPENDQVRAPVVDCRDLSDPPAFELAGQQHHAMVVNLSRSRIVPDPNAEIETVGRDDVAIVLREELVQQAMAIVRVRENGPSPVWNIVTAASEQISSDLVLQAELTTLLEMDGTWRTQATYTIRNQGHQFLAVKLPADSRVLSVMVRGQAGRTFGRMFGEQPVHLIPLPATSAADLSYQVVLTTEGSLAASLPELFDIVGDDLEIPLPLVISPSESTEFGLPVGQLLWTVHLPDEVVAEPVAGSGETNLTRHDRNEFLEQSLAIGISNYASESEELIQMATDEQVSLAQRQQALESLEEMNWKIQNWSTVDGTSPGVVSSDLANEQSRLLMGNSMIIEQNSGLLQTDVFSQSISQQDIGRFFCASNGAVILGDNRPASIAAGGVIESFGFAERGEATATETRTQGRAALRDQAQNQSLDFVQQQATTPQPSNLHSFNFRGVEDPFEATLGLIIQQTQSVHHEMFPVELGDSGTQGGLSLAMPLPLRGDQLSFSRVGGDGKLVLRFRPTTTLETGLGWIWALIWGIAIAWSVIRITRKGSDLESAWNAAACPMIVLGMLGFLLLGDPARWVGFTLLAIGFMTWAWQYRRPTPVSRPEV